MNTAKIKGWLTLKNSQAENLALKLGILRGSRDYTRFIILGRSRTGSNFLRGFLKSHPQIVSLGEIFREPNRIEFDSAYFPDGEKYLAGYREDPVNFLQNEVFRKYKSDIRAVGFKIFYYHAPMDPFKKIWDSLQSDKEIHVLHIKRRNMLETHVSRIKADRNNSWVNVTGEKERQTSVFVDPIKCQQDFEMTSQWEQEADEAFREHPTMEIIYEDLAENPVIKMQKVQIFLGVDEQHLEPRTYKQSELTLAQSINNYAELKKHFDNTPWSQFFVE